MSAGDQVYLPVLPSFKGFFKETQKNAKAAGKSAGKSFADGVEKATERAKKAVEKATDAQERAHNRAANAADKTRVAEAKLSEVMGNAKSKTSDIARATAALNKARRDEESASKAAERADKKLGKAQQDLKKASTEAGDALKLGAEDSKKFAGQLDKAEGSSGKLLDKLGGFKGVVAGAAGSFAAFKTAKNILFDVGKAFDSMEDTIRVGTGASGAAFDGLTDSAKKVAATVPAMDGGMEQIGTTLADLNTRLGLTGKPLEDLTSQFVQLQNMGVDADINDVTGAFTQFGVAAEDTPAALDSLFQISQATGRSISELTSNLDKSGPALQEMGFGLQESAGLLGSLDKAGLDADKTMGYMTKALASFAKEGKDPKKALWGTIDAIDQLTKSGKDTEALNLANQLFGDRGGTGFVAAVKSGKFAYTDFMDSIGATQDTILGVADETASIGEKWQIVKQKGMLAIEPIASKVFDFLVPALEGAVSVVGDFWKKMQGLADFFKRHQTWLGPLVAAIGGAVGAWIAWNGAIVAWQTVTKIATGVQAAFNMVMNANPVMLLVMAIAALVAGLVYFFTQTETGRKAWEAFTDGLSSAWRSFVDGFHAAVSWITDTLWPGFTGALSAGKDFIVDTVFGGIKNGLSAVGDFFGSVVDGIRNVWDKLRGALAKPINFMINTVYNNGILKAWNVIAGILPGISKGSPLSSIPEHATGGRITGPGTGTSDDVLMWGSNGEHMLTAADVKKLGGHGAVYALRDAVESGRPFSYDGSRLAVLPKVDNRAGDLLGAAPSLFPKYAKGGEIRPMWEAQLIRAHKWAQSRNGRPYVLGGSANGGGGTDCSGFMSGIANVIQGGDGARQWATMAFNGGGNTQMPSGPQGFVAGLGPGFSIGVTNGGAAGGHTAGTLGPAGAFGAVNVESGGAAPSQVKYGGNAAGADGSYFRTHYHLPIGADGAFVSGGGVSPAVMKKVITEKLTGAIDKIMGPIVDRLPSPPPQWQGIPRGMYEKGKDGLGKFAGSAVDKIGDKLATVYTAVSKVADVAADVAGKVWDKTLSVVGLRDTGGMVSHGQVVTNQSGKPEYMLDPAMTVGFLDFVHFLPALVTAMGRADWADAAADFSAAAVKEFGKILPTVAGDAKNWGAEQATAGLDLVGLGGLVGLGNAVADFADWGAVAHELRYGPPPVDTPGDAAAAATPPVPTVGSPVAAAKSANAGVKNAGGLDVLAPAGDPVIIQADGPDDFVRVGDLKKVEGRVLKLEDGKKKPAAARMRGGVV